MVQYELTNEQRKYFGLNNIDENWHKQILADSLTIFYDNSTIVKVINYGYGYLEYDVDIRTKNRQIILPKTTKGKEQKLTVVRIRKIKGSGVQFSGSFQGGGVHVYDNRRNIFFIKGFIEEGDIKTYRNIDNWVKVYIENLPSNYFDWLNNELTQKRQKIKVKAGDIIAYKIGQKEYGFARILLNVFEERKNNEICIPEFNCLHLRSLIVAPYAYYDNKLDIDIDIVIRKRTLPSICIFDLDVYRGEMPVIGHRPLSEIDKKIPFPKESKTVITIP